MENTTPVNFPEIPASPVLKLSWWGAVRSYTLKNLSLWVILNGSGRKCRK